MHILLAVWIPLFSMEVSVKDSISRLSGDLESLLNAPTTYTIQLGSKQVQLPTLCYCAYKGWLDELKRLNSLDIALRKKFGISRVLEYVDATYVGSLVHWAVFSRDKAVIDFVVSTGINALASNKDTPVHWAIKFDLNDSLQYLIDAKVPISERNAELDAPIHLAVRRQNRSAIELLLKAGADINCPAAQRETALLLATIKNNIAIIQLLLSFGADGNIGIFPNEKLAQLVTLCAQNKGPSPADIAERVIKGGKTPLHYAVENNSIEAASCLLEAGVATDTLDEDGLTAFHRALASNNSSMINLFMEKGASTQGALQYAVVQRSTEMVRRLLLNNVPINDQDAAGETALHIACKNGDHMMRKFLEAAGASYSIKDAQDSTPLDYLVCKATRGIRKCLPLYIIDGKAPDRAVTAFFLGLFLFDCTLLQSSLAKLSIDDLNDFISRPNLSDWEVCIISHGIYTKENDVLDDVDFWHAVEHDDLIRAREWKGNRPADAAV